MWYRVKNGACGGGGSRTDSKNLFVTPSLKCQVEKRQRHHSWATGGTTGFSNLNKFLEKIQTAFDHETYRLLAVQTWSARNHETYRHLNHRDSMSRDGVNETMKPRNHYTYGYLDVPEMECTIAMHCQNFPKSKHLF